MINFWVWFFEERDTILTMLTISNARHILLCLKSLSVEIRKTQQHLQRSKFYSQLTLFQNPQLLGTIYSGHDVICTPVWPAWVGFETAIFWQCSPGTVETQRLYPLRQRFTWSKTRCNRQQLWKAVITGDTVTRLSIPIRGRGKSPEEGQRWNLAEA